MAKVIVAPDEFVEDDTTSIFLAGGITGCPDWQTEMIQKFKKNDKFTLLNPRRKDFDVSNPKNSQKQIEWEFEALRKADAILFWFPMETLCPIVLYELGCALGRNSTKSTQGLYIGCHPKYQRKFDVEEQVKNMNRVTYGAEWSIVESLNALHKKIIKEYPF